MRTRPDVAALATLDANKLCVLAWHYHDDDLPGPEAEVELTLDHLPVVSGQAKLQQFRIDENWNSLRASVQTLSEHRPFEVERMDPQPDGSKKQATLHP